MADDQKTKLRLEIAHVLFIDIVGYSKLLINEQSEQIQKLKQIVRGTEQFRLAEAEGKLLRLPTGDGGALVFRNSPEAPVLCALEISKALKSHPELHVRMGIHSGPVNEVTDLNEQANVAGAGINIAQRVMDCGEAGHILVSKRVADDLEQYQQWRSLLHELGECEVKHGLRISILNLYGGDAGNPALPEKFKQTNEQKQSTAAPMSVAGALFFFHRSVPSAPATPARAEKSIAVLPFANMSADKGDEYLSDGVSDELITALSKITGLQVKARTSSFAFIG
jgi:adenylate cyclase